MSKEYESELRRQACRERNRLVKILKESTPERAKALRPVCENVGFLKARLDLARDELEGEDLIIEYQHGKDQSGTMENPIFRAYEGLFRAYIAGLGKILDALPPAKAANIAEKEPKKTQLALIMAKREASGQ